MMSNINLNEEALSMRVATVSHFSGALTLAIFASTANMVSVMPVMADVNIGALTCQPTAASTAGNMIWHQHYLINPPGADSTTRWVMCNIPFDHATLPSTFYVGAFGLNNEGAANLVSTCYVNVVDLRNGHVPTAFSGEPFLNNPGQDMSYTKIMTTKPRVDYLWSAWATMTIAGVRAGMMDPPPTPIDSTGTNSNQRHWTINVNCQLKPGQALSMVSLFPTTIP